MMDWLLLKFQIAMWAGLAQDALHIHAGIIVMLVAAAVLRRSVASPWPLLVVFVVELVNEAIDLTNWAPGSRSIEGGGTFRDIWNTMLQPVLLFLVARYTTLFTRSPPPAAPSADAPAP